MTQRRVDINPMNNLTSILIGVGFFVLVFFVLKGIFNLLWYLAPALIIVALILNYKVVIDYVKMLFSLLKNNPLMGIVGIVLSFMLFPVVAAFLAGKAWLYRKIDGMGDEMGIPQMNRNRETEYAEYEEVDSTPSEPLQLPEIEIEKPIERKTDYDDMFK